MRKTTPRVFRFVRSIPLLLSHHTIVTPPTVCPKRANAFTHILCRCLHNLMTVEPRFIITNFCHDCPCDAMGDEVRTRLCSPVATQAAICERYLASGRNGDLHFWQETLSLARRRSEWIRTRRNRSEPPQYQGCKALVDASIEQARRCTQTHLNRQASFLWCSTAADHVEHLSHKGLNNRAENSHVPLRKKECSMQGFRSSGGLQRFVSTFSALRNLFVPLRHNRSALGIHLHRLRAMAEWKANDRHTRLKSGPRKSRAIFRLP